MCVKDVKIYFIGLKKTCLGVLDIEEIRDINNETGLKEGGGIKMLTTVLHSRAAPSLKYLPLGRSCTKQNVFSCMAMFFTTVRTTFDTFIER